jgi:hypothetical protein
MTKLEKLKAEADTARVACNTAYDAFAAYAEACNTAFAVAAYADADAYAAAAAAAEDAGLAAVAYDAACDAHATAAEVYQAELNKAQEENDND